MQTKDFTLVFEKFNEIAPPAGDLLESRETVVALTDGYLEELDELAELRRVVSEITDPEPLSFTTT